MEDWIIGMVLVFVGCCCSAVGLILLKHSTNVEEHLPLHRRPFWAVGVVFLIVNASVIDVIAFSLAPLTLVAPFSGVTIVLTTWLASSGMLFVKETVDTHDMISTALALVGVPIPNPNPKPKPNPDPGPIRNPSPNPDQVGVTITTSFGPHIDDAKGANELSACFGQTDVHIFAAVSMGIFGASWLTYFAHRRLRQATWFRICVYAYTAALAGSASMLLLKVSQCTNEPMNQCTDAPMHRRTNAPMHQCTNAPMHQCTNAHRRIGALPQAVGTGMLTYPYPYP